MTEQPSLIRIENIPVRPPRDGIPSEAIYLRKWQAFAERAEKVANENGDHGDEFLLIFWNTNREWSQEQASAAASFVTWLGTNAGQCLLLECQRMCSAIHTPASAYLAAWALCNDRKRYMNHGLRTVEFMLAEKYPIVNGPFSHRVDWELVPEVSMAQMDAIESVVEWLATSQGRAFVAAAEAEISAHKKTEHLFAPA